MRIVRFLVERNPWMKDGEVEANLGILVEGNH
jgi:hypothetical protein